MFKFFQLYGCWWACCFWPDLSQSYKGIDYQGTVLPKRNVTLARTSTITR